MTDSQLLTLAAQYDRETTPQWIVKELESRGYQYVNGEWD